jgi:hypothetical protein
MASNTLNAGLKSPDKVPEKVAEKKAEEIKIEDEKKEPSPEKTLDKPEEVKKVEGTDTIISKPSETITNKPAETPGIKEEVMESSLQSSRSVEIEDNPPKKKTSPNGNLSFKVDGYTDDENMW